MNTDPNPWLNANASHVSTAGETSPDTSRYSLTIDEASRLFTEAGVPRAPRSITRFCQLGELDCIRVDTEKNFKYLIDQHSVEKRILQLKQALHFTSKTSQDMSRHVEQNNETSLDTTRHDDNQRETEQPDENVDVLIERIQDLEGELLNARIDNAAKEKFITQLATERKDFMSQITDMSYQLGAAQTKLQQLEAPRPQPEGSHVPPAGETVQPEPMREAIEVQSTPEPAATSASATPTATAEQPKRSFFDRLRGR